MCAASTLTALAQTPAATPASTPPAKHEGGKHEGKGPNLEALTPAEREQFLAARKKAEADPAVIAAKEGQDKKAMHDAMHAAMLKADPTIGPILEKLAAAHKAEKKRK